MPSSDPNEKMENLLRAYARKRREEGGEPIELSPAVRARFQAEVRRTLGKSTTGRTGHWAFSLGNWLKFGLIGAVAAVVTLLIWPGSPESSDRRLGVVARTTNAPILADAKALPPPQATLPSAPAPSLPAGGSVAATEEKKSVAQLDAAKETPVATTPPTSATPLASAPSVATRSISGSGSIHEVAIAPAASTALIVSNVIVQNAPSGGEMAGRGGRRGGRGGGGFGGGGGVAASPELPIAAPAQIVAAAPPPAGPAAPADTVSIRLASARPETPLDQPLDRAAANRAAVQKDNVASAVSDVLATFQIERTGQQVRIVDADGSVYNGSVLGADVLAKMPLQNKMETANNSQAYPQAGTYNNNSAPLANNANILQMQKEGYAGNLANSGQMPQNIYNNVQTQNSQAAPNAATLGVPRKAGDAASSVPANFFTFQVNGTNRKLNQNVTVTGTCTVAPVQNFKYAIGNISQLYDRAALNAPAPAGSPQAGYNNQSYSDGNAVNLKNAQNAQASPLLWHVTGQVQVGPSNHFDLDASVVQP